MKGLPLKPEPSEAPPDPCPPLGRRLPDPWGRQLRRPEKPNQRRAEVWVSGAFVRAGFGVELRPFGAFRAWGFRVFGLGFKMR